MINLDRSNPQHRSFARLILAKHDIQSARFAINHLIENVSSQHDPMFEPLCCAAVICYSRPFIGRREYPAISTRFTRFSDEILRAIHSYILGHRNHFQAHRDEDYNLVKLLPKGTEVSWDAGKQTGKLLSHGESVTSQSIKLETFPQFKALCDFQIDRLKAKIDAEKERLFP